MIGLGVYNESMIVDTKREYTKSVFILHIFLCTKRYIYDQDIKRPICT